MAIDKQKAMGLLTLGAALGVHISMPLWLILLFLIGSLILIATNAKRSLHHLLPYVPFFIIPPLAYTIPIPTAGLSPLIALALILAVWSTILVTTIVFVRVFINKHTR